MSRVAFLGLGAMGARMAANLLKAGHQVAVWNRNPARAAPLVAAGATLAATPRDAAVQAQFVIAMLRDDDASRQVWLDPEAGALRGLGSDAIAIESSTLTLRWVAELGAAIGPRFLDAPVVGSRPQADTAQLVYLVGGTAESFAAAQPVLAAMGAATHHVGPAGQGATLKLAVNSLFGIQLAALGEMLGLMRRCGITEERVAELLGPLPIMSPAAKVAAGAMLQGSFAPLFPIALVEKDFHCAVAAADAVGAAVPLTQAALVQFAAATARGHGGDNITGIVQLYR